LVSKSVIELGAAEIGDEIYLASFGSEVDLASVLLHYSPIDVAII
jgi:hypothetical protein